MEIVFRDLSSSGATPGEILIRPDDLADEGRRDLATLVVTKGLKGLAHGDGPPRRIVVSADPTLDDLLAASFAERLVSGGTLPPGAAAFARYAALAREGLHPGDAPPAESIEGVFLAQRNAHGEDLDSPSVGQRFLADWRRTAAALLLAAEKGVDPFHARLCGGPEFARERAFLAKDREVYRQDVLSGERYVVRIPGGPPEASALVLFEPKSLLAKQWARSDPDAPVGGTYLLLGVRRGPGLWVFSTDPVQRLPIGSLALALQTAEANEDAARAATDPWFDGKPFGHTLVAAPKGGTRLDDADVLRVFAAWGQARRPTRPGVRRALFVGALGVAVLAAALSWILRSREDEPAFAPIDFTTRGAPLDPAQVMALKSAGGGVRGFALLVAVGSGRRPLPGAVPDAAKVYRLLRDRFGYAPQDMLLLVDDPAAALDADGSRLPAAPGLPTRGRVAKAIEEIGERVKAADGTAPLQFLFYYAGHGTVEEPGERVGYLILSGYHDDLSVAQDLRGYDMGHLASDLRRKIASKHHLLLIDCCYSGFSVNKRGDPTRDPSRVYELWKNPALAVVTAGKEDERVYERAGASFFTTVLLEALGGGDAPRSLADGYRTGIGGWEPPVADGIVTDAELGVYLRDQVPARMQRAGSDRQTPLYFRGLEGDDVGQFLFVPRPAR
jgi:hypothetical protein